MNLDKDRDHALYGDWKSYRECHIKPDWLNNLQAI